MKKIGRNKNRISTKVITAADTNQLMQSAIQIHLSGQLHEAELQYRQVIALQPRHADALHYLGVIAYQKGQCLEAEQLITLAIAENPTNASYFSNLGVALRD